MKYITKQITELNERTLKTKNQTNIKTKSILDKLINEISEIKDEFKVDNSLFKIHNNKIISINYTFKSLNTDTNLFCFCHNLIEYDHKYEKNIKKIIEKYRNEIENVYNEYSEFKKSIISEYTKILNEIENLNENEIKEIIEEMDLNYYQFLGPKYGVEKILLITNEGPQLIVEVEEFGETYIDTEELNFKNYLKLFIKNRIYYVKNQEIISVNKHIQDYI